MNVFSKNKIGIIYLVQKINDNHCFENDADYTFLVLLI